MINDSINKFGLKATKFGWIPEHWSVESFSKVVDINCESLSSNTPDGFSFYYISLSDVNKGIINHPKEKISYTLAPERARRKFKKGDILLSTVRPNLQGFAFIDFPSDDYVCSTGFAVLRPKNNNAGQYLYQFLYSHQVIEYFYSCVVGSNYPAINTDDIARILVPLPPLEEQQKIAKILSTWDRAIDRVQRLIEARRRLMKGLLWGLLTGKIRFQEFGEPLDGGKEFPKGWKKTMLHHIADILVSNVDKLVDENETPVLLCNYMDVYSNEYITNSIDFMRASASYSEIARFHLKKGDVIITKDSETSGDIASTSVLIDEIDNLICGYHLAIIRPKMDLVHPIFLSKMLTIGKSHEHFVTHANGVTRYGLTLSALTKAPIWLPNLEEQIRIADLLIENDREINLLNKQIELFRLQKKGLMQKLLKGEIRVKIN